jgi:uncharacterized membrane protein
MKSRAELKQLSKEQIKGNLGILFLAGLVPVAILAVVIGIVILSTLNSVETFVFGIILYFAFFLSLPAFMVGYLKMYLSISNGVKPEISTLFDGFNIFGKSLWLAIIQWFFINLWSYLLLVPGIIKSISYSMSFFILAERPYLTAREALKESKKIMHGHKMDAFVLYLSFIGWGFLCAITFGLAGIYAVPYIATTYTNFYNEIK